jgi:endoglucanase
MNKKYFGYTLIFLGLVLFLSVLYINAGHRNTVRPFSNYTLLSSSWENYKQHFINQDGRVIDYSQQDITTSEGQSYALLRAVYIDDKVTFDQVWKWTKDNMGRSNDNLLGWRWGLRNDKQYGFMENGGDNSASDADTDIALALIFAGKRWGDENYINEAKLILNDIWNIETSTANNRRYLIAGNWSKNQDYLIINPSYFAPYAWRIFSTVDTDHDWSSLIDPAYNLLERSGQDKLDKDKGVGLPPNWLMINRIDGSIGPTNNGELNTDYGFDAIRIPWKIALDYQWNNDKRAYDYLINSFGQLAERYRRDNKLPIIISHNGSVVQDQENPVMYATAIGYFLIADKDLAKTVYEEKIIKLYSNDANMFNPNLPYYEQNWLWFGAALYNEQLKPFQ